MSSMGRDQIEPNDTRGDAVAPFVAAFVDGPPIPDLPGDREDSERAHLAEEEDAIDYAEVIAFVMRRTGCKPTVAQAIVAEVAVWLNGGAK